MPEIDAPAENHILGALGDETRETLLRQMRVVELKQGATLHEPGDPITQVYFPWRGGAVSFITVLSDGSGVETHMVGREGVTCSSVQEARRPATVRAIVQLPGEGWRIETGRFIDAVQRLPELRGALEEHSARIIQDLEQTAACNAAHRLEPRLAKWLLRSHDRAGGDLLPLTQEFLAHMLGAQRTTVTEVARALHLAGAIEYTRGKITILNRPLLERMSCECYRAMARRGAAVSG